MKKEEFKEILDGIEEIKQSLIEIKDKSKNFAEWMKSKELKEEDFTKEQLEQLDKLADEMDEIVEELFLAE